MLIFTSCLPFDAPLSIMLPQLSTLYHPSLSLYSCSTYSCLLLHFQQLHKLLLCSLFMHTCHSMDTFHIPHAPSPSVLFVQFCFLAYLMYLAVRYCLRPFKVAHYCAILGKSNEKLLPTYKKIGITEKQTAV